MEYIDSLPGFLREIDLSRRYTSEDHLLRALRGELSSPKPLNFKGSYVIPQCKFLTSPNARGLEKFCKRKIAYLIHRISRYTGYDFDCINSTSDMLPKVTDSHFVCSQEARDNSQRKVIVIVTPSTQNGGSSSVDHTQSQYTMHVLAFRCNDHSSFQPYHNTSSFCPRKDIPTLQPRRLRKSLRQSSRAIVNPEILDFPADQIAEESEESLSGEITYIAKGPMKNICKDVDSYPVSWPRLTAVPRSDFVATSSIYD